MKPISALAATLAAALALAAAPALADDVTDTLESALMAYEEGDIDYAIEELDYAKTLMSAMKTDQLGAFLPEAPAGWTREIDTESGNVVGMMGGGISAQADYTNGSDSFTVMIIANNPMVTAASAMLNNAAMLGMKVERVGRQKFVDDNGSLTGLVDNRIMVQAEGADKATLISVLETIDYRALQDFSR